MSTTHHSTADLERFAVRAFTAVGVSHEHAEMAAHAILEADRRGQHGHGVVRIPSYVDQLQSGHLNPKADIRLLHETGVSAVVDGDHALGQVVAAVTSKVAIEKAKSAGLAWVGSRRSGHPGAGGVYAARALEQDMVGMYFAVSRGRVVAPWGGREPMLGTNPIAVAIPAGQRPAVQVDVATSVASVGKINLARSSGEQLPSGWVIDDFGESITDPENWRAGTLAPIGEHKGYGLGLVVSIFAGLMNGVPMEANQGDRASAGQAFIAVRPDLFGEFDVFCEAMDAYTAEIHRSVPRQGFDAVRVPGDRLHRTRKSIDREGVPLTPEMADQFRDLADRLGIESPDGGS